MQHMVTEDEHYAPPHLATADQNTRCKSTQPPGKKAVAQTPSAAQRSQGSRFNNRDNQRQQTILGCFCRWLRVFRRFSQ